MTDVAGPTQPLKVMPRCWEDDKRMNSLFLAFKRKDLNPVDWESKMKFWLDSVDKWCLEKEDCTLSVTKLESQFRRKERVPKCLSTVLEHLLRIGELKQKDEFLSINPQQTWSDWAVSSFVRGPIVWSFTKLKEALIEVDKGQTDYVYLKYLKVRGEELLSAVKSRNAFLLSLEEIEQILIDEGHTVSAGTVYLIIHWLQTQRLAIIINFEKKTLVKFSSDNKPVVNISEAETAIFTLLQTKLALVKNIESLETDKRKCVEDARNYIKKEMRQSAKSCLRKKKELEKCIEKRVSALDNTEVLLSRIQESESDSKVLDAYRMGLAALKVTFKQAGLTEDSVINTMAEVQEVIDVHDEIQTALSESISPLVDDELEKELTDLLENSKSENLVRISDLPEVPTEDIAQNTFRSKDFKSASLLLDG